LRLAVAICVVLDVPLPAGALDDSKGWAEMLSPNRKFGLELRKLEPSQQKENSDGLTLDESVFLVDLSSKRPPVEVSESFRKSSDASWPQYEAYWSEESIQVAVVARRRRDAELVAYRVSERGWTRIELPKFDPTAEAIAAAKPGGAYTSQWELQSVAWRSDKQLSLLVTAYLKASPPLEVTLSYTFTNESDRWRLNRGKPEVKAE
jgi:hypothetical protein